VRGVTVSKFEGRASALVQVDANPPAMVFDNGGEVGVYLFAREVQAFDGGHVLGSPWLADFFPLSLAVGLIDPWEVWRAVRDSIERQARGENGRGGDATFPLPPEDPAVPPAGEPCIDCDGTRTVAGTCVDCSDGLEQGTRPGAALERSLKADRIEELADGVREDAEGLGTGTLTAHGERVMEAGRMLRLADRVSMDVGRLRAPLTRNWTPRRGRIKDGQRAEADRLERVERGLRAIAGALRENRLPGSLAGALTRAAVERLVAKQDRALAELVTATADAETIAEDAERKRLDDIRKAEDAFRTCDAPGFFPTPPAVVAAIFERLDVRPGMSLLEPSAGLGHLAEFARGEGADVYCVERHLGLAGVLESKGFEVLGCDFLQVGPKLAKVDRVAMNPPFERGQDVAHVRAAFSCLKPGGRLVAVMTPRGAAEIISELGGEMEPLPVGSFNGAGAFRSTGVHCCLVVIDADGEVTP
jgi:hypothetical protein